MERIFSSAYIIVFVISFIIFFYLLLKSNFEKFFKQGKITEIRISYFLMSFILATIFSIGFMKIIESLYNVFLN